MNEAINESGMVIQIINVARQREGRLPLCYQRHVQRLRPEQLYGKPYRPCIRFSVFPCEKIWCADGYLPQHRRQGRKEAGERLPGRNRHQDLSGAHSFRPFPRKGGTGVRTASAEIIFVSSYNLKVSPHNPIFL